MKARWLLVLVIALLAACRKEDAALVPDTTWDLFYSAGTVPVDATSQHRMEGIYTVAEGDAVFGSEVALKWSWTRDGLDTSYHVSIFGGQDIVYFTGEGRYLDSTLLLNGYWRKMAGTATGLCRLMVLPDEGVQHLLGDGSGIGPDSIRISGVFGSGQNVPDQLVTLRYARPLHDPASFIVLAHRGGGRNADLLPASENSVELILMAARFGATGVEVDVRLTSDGVPVLYHDETLNTRLIQDCGLFGPLEDYSYAQLSGIVRLINGERIPTLREALEVIVRNTDLRYVWLDLKSADAMAQARALQEEFMGTALAEGRDLHILLGLPEQDVVDAFLQLPDHEDAPALCELSVAVTQSVDAAVWAPRWTLGLQHAEVAQMHAEGRKVFVWTLDLEDYIHQYLYEGSFDGILSNYPSIVAYDAYARP